MLHTPFFIWHNNKDKKTIKEVTSQLNVLPTVLNLYGIDHNSNYYIGTEALDNNYHGSVFFSDYSWYDGSIYVDGGVITKGKEIDSLLLEDKNYYINYLIKKNLCLYCVIFVQKWMVLNLILIVFMKVK